MALTTRIFRIKQEVIIINLVVVVLSKALRPGNINWSTGRKVLLPCRVPLLHRSEFYPRLRIDRYYEKEEIVVAPATLGLRGASTAFVDELGVYPVVAHVTTDTYDHLNGITSIDDPCKATSYYEYDNSDQLK
jgi:hypothetical protein